jgi:predicted TIM-barrel fold metal-dependent hydrolase
VSAAASGGWDCHTHVFGPYDRYPLADARSYTPPEATAAMHRALRARLGLTHGVLVHPSAYGEDHRLLLDTLAADATLRGVIVPRPGDAAPDFRGLRERGVRGARFSHRSAGDFVGAATFADLRATATRLADAGLHAELWTDTRALPAVADEIARLPVPVVIDHMGGFDVAAGVDDPGFRALLDLVASGRVWVKLCAYRNLLATADFDAGRPFHRALVAAHPGRLVWGSDWPHLRVTPAPDAAQLLATLRAWTGDPAVEHAILFDNPAGLYG